MNPDAPLFDKTHRARLSAKVDQLMKSAELLRAADAVARADALLIAIPRLCRRAAILLGCYGFELEAIRIDLLLQNRAPDLLRTTADGSIAVVVELVQYLEDISFVLTEDPAKLPPLLPPAAPVVPAASAAPSRPARASADIPTLKAPLKKAARKRR